MITMPRTRYTWMLIVALLFVALVLATIWFTTLGPMHPHALHMLFADDGTNIVIRNH